MKKFFTKKNKTDPFAIESLNALTYKTPYLLFDLHRLEKRYAEFQQYLKKFTLHYAVKSNPAHGILEKLHALGSSFEIASFNEYKFLESISVGASKIIFSAPVKSPFDIKAAFKVGIDRFAVDCFSEIDKIARNAPGARIYIRIAVNDLGSKWPLSQKFGAPPREVLELMQYALSLGLQTYGLTFHVGSQSTDTNSWELAIQTVGNIMKELDKHNIRIEMLNFGGGFPAKYTEDIPELDEISLLIKTAIKRFIPYKVEYMIEPGRALVSECGVIVSSVISRTIRGSKNWLYLDIGAYNGLMETQPTQGSLVYPLTSSKDITKEGRDKIPFVITGPSCDSLDTMFHGTKLAKNITLGDHIYISSAGAYTLSYASSFNGFKPPKIYYVQEL